MRAARYRAGRGWAGAAAVRALAGGRGRAAHLGGCAPALAPIVRRLLRRRRREAEFRAMRRASALRLRDDAAASLTLLPFGSLAKNRVISAARRASRLAAPRLRIARRESRVSRLAAGSPLATGDASDGQEIAGGTNWEETNCSGGRRWGCGGVQGEVPPAQKSLPLQLILGLFPPSSYDEAFRLIHTHRRRGKPNRRTLPGLRNLPAAAPPRADCAKCGTTASARAAVRCRSSPAFLADTRGTPPCVLHSAALSPSRCLRSAPAPAAAMRAVRPCGGVQQRQLRADRSARLFVPRFHSARSGDAAACDIGGGARM